MKTRALICLWSVLLGTCAVAAPVTLTELEGNWRGTMPPDTDAVEFWEIHGPKLKISIVRGKTLLDYFVHSEGNATLELLSGDRLLVVFSTLFGGELQPALVFKITQTRDGIELKSGSARPILLKRVAAIELSELQRSALEETILRNLRVLAAARDQFFVENGVRVATYADLVGPKKYLKELVPVAGEDYQSLRFKAEEPTLAVKTSYGKIVSGTW